MRTKGTLAFFCRDAVEARVGPTTPPKVRFKREAQAQAEREEAERKAQAEREPKPGSREQPIVIN